MMFDEFRRLGVERRTCLPVVCSCGNSVYVLGGRRIGTAIGTWTGDETWKDISDALAVRMGESEREPCKLMADIRGRGFVKAAAHLEKARHSMFSHLRRWLALGIACPRASSLVKRMMRALAR